MVGPHALPHEVSAIYIYIYIYIDFNRTKIIKIGLTLPKLSHYIVEIYFGEKKDTSK